MSAQRMKKSTLPKPLQLSKARIDGLIDHALTDAYGESEQVTGFYTMLEHDLHLPFETQIRDPREGTCQPNGLCQLFERDQQFGEQMGAWREAPGGRLSEIIVTGREEWTGRGGMRHVFSGPMPAQILPSPTVYHLECGAEIPRMFARKLAR